MKIIFAGTPPFAAAALAALHAAGHEVALVLTQPDRPAGRGMKLKAGAVADEAARLKLALAKPESLKGEAIQATLRAIAPDAIIVAAYGLMLPQTVLDIPKFGCINIHGSLLPRWRGAAPVQQAIEAGDTETGIAIMRMDAGLDTGAVLLTEKIGTSLVSTFVAMKRFEVERFTEAVGALDVETVSQWEIDEYAAHL